MNKKVPTYEALNYDVYKNYFLLGRTMISLPSSFLLYHQ